uniref:Plasminogen n=1 Tax=Denticeps clupeoides TaxID=299321 RepID=A0AAY4BXE5_9TELE
MLFFVRNYCNIEWLLFLCLSIFLSGLPFVISKVPVAQSDVLDEYVKTDGAWILTLAKRTYTVKTAAECADKCDAESAFTCRSFIHVEKDKDCLTIPANSKVELVLHGMRSALFEKKLYLKECVDGIGTNYRGTKTKTKTGRTCQQWNAKVPHVPNMTPEKYPKADLEKNFCRNPDGDASGPWCYTTDPEKRWESCQTIFCTSDECMQCNGEDFQGKISQTESGLTCQHWDSQTPHDHGYFPTAIPDKRLEENYCRNPDGDPRPWCFTTDHKKRWEFCNIPCCTSEPPSAPTELTCKDDGSSYRGTVAVTTSGKTCQRWSTQTPHKHGQIPDNYPCKGLESNYCRNPNNEKKPWCYTIDPNTRWEYCHVPLCSPEDTVIQQAGDCYEDNGSSYRGATSETISGRKCQSWSSVLPHNHNKTPQNYPQADLRDNLCRNPDGDRSPWCYTEDPSKRWEYCKVEKCYTGTVKPTETVMHAEPTASEPSTADLDCKVGNGADYRGSVSKTVKGVTCQAWASMIPHHHGSFTPETHPAKGLEGNQCRNPDKDINGPWCYTTDVNKKWDYCPVPVCTNQKCGQTQAVSKPCPLWIFGGCVSKAHAWPWQISLRTNTGVHVCGGALIAPQWVLTAAYCLQSSSQPNSYKVSLGIHSLRATEESRQERGVQMLFLEPTGKDIALLKLDTPAIINDKVNFACLPKKDSIVPASTECHVTGWGETHGDGLLKETKLTVLENMICNEPGYLNGRVRDHEMCVGTDICQGDAGGPLVCYSQHSFVLQGVTLWGLSCAQAIKPGLYTRVSRFVDWIEREMQNN